MNGNEKFDVIVECGEYRLRKGNLVVGVDIASNSINWAERQYVGGAEKVGITDKGRANVQAAIAGFIGMIGEPPLVR